MRIRNRIALAGTLLALAVSTTQAVAADPRPTGTATASRSVTLITGDRVLVSGPGSGHAISPAPGRERMGFSTFTSGGHLHVIPADALALVTSGTVDRRLFDVTALIESGYDDASRNTLPVIVTYEGTAPASLAAATVTRTLPSINGAAVNADKANAAALWTSVTPARTMTAGVKKLWLDGKRESTLDRSTVQIGAPAAWEAGFTGTGVKIAVLDTGVDQTHPDLAGREVAEQNFSDAPDNVDRFGHGTHVASIAAGSGAKANGKYRGVAHGAQVLDGKVLNDSGSGLESWIVAGMEWAAEQGAKVVNMSLGGADTPEVDPLEQAVNTLSAEHGTLFVIAAGNSGNPKTVSSPGSADAALTVGAVNRDESIAPFSSRGPRVGDGAIKPDITAPGVEIVAAKAAAGTIGNPVEDGYVSLSGTSMATPHVAGSAALLAQQHAEWTGAQLKAALTASAQPNPALTVFDQGSGRVDVAKAIAQSVVTEPTNVGLGTVQWPHNDDQPVTKPLTYRNTGGADVTLSLSVDVTGPDGQPAPAGMVSLSANQITVPAGGSARVDLTGNTRAATVDGFYTGAILATGADTAVATPVAINREVESYNLTITVRDLAGAPTDQYSTLLVGLGNPTFESPHDPDGTVTARLPRGQYLVDTIVVTGEGQQFTLLTQPRVSLDRNVTVDMDARAARPVSVRAPDPAATLALGDVGYDLQFDGTGFSRAFLTGNLAGVSTAHLGPALPANQLIARVNTQWTVPSGAFYGLAWFEFGAVPTGFSREVTAAELATVQAEFGPGSPDRVGARFAAPQPTTGSSGSWAVLLDVPLPGARTEFYNAADVLWATGLLQVVEEPFTIELDLTSGTRALEAGQTYSDRFNHAVFGPAFPGRQFPWVSRSGDVIDVFVPMFSDSAGNAGFSVVESGTTRLFRDGEPVGEEPAAGGGRFEVPAEPAEYRLTTEAVRPGIFDVATSMSATWTFRSGHAGGTDPVVLPLAAIRFTPALDDANAAPAGQRFEVPVALQPQSGSPLPPESLTVDVSYDEGQTWQQAEVTGNQTVLLQHPADATSVSLRATARDGAGNSVEHTIIRAYKLEN